jgi:P-type Mg2+ transporter
MGDDSYLLNQKELFRKLNSSEKGLTESEASSKLKEYGFNELPERDKKSIFSVFFYQFKSPLTLILLFASILSIFLKAYTDSIIILCIIFVNSLLGFYQEYKSEKALASLKKYISFKAKVLRDNKTKEIDVKDLVPGDVVFLNLGDIVPADIRIIESQELSVNESTITGESLPVQKSAEIIRTKDSFSSKRSNMVFMGSVVSGGIGKGIVLSTGKNTEFGKIANILSAKETPSSFQKGIKNFGTLLIKVVIIFTVFVFWVNAFLGKGLLSSFLFAVALAVGITPELLPIIITISLSAGAIQMAEKRVIVKKLSSIEDFGNIDILCTDKTGTLTKNELNLENYFDLDGKKQKEIVEYAAMCTSTIFNDKSPSGNIIDVAICSYAKSQKMELKSYKIIKDIEFDYERRRKSMVVQYEKKLLVSKGDPKSIFSICSQIKKGGSIVPISGYKVKINNTFEELSKKGYRVIAVAYKEVKSKNSYDEKDEKDLIFLGFLIFLDPPKDTVKAALEKMKNLGIDIKILTGDNELITETVCRKVGLEIKGKIFTGPELEKLSEQEFLKVIEKNNIFARVTPDQKFKIVSSLKNKNHIVGFLGDGVNDAPALKAADIGITVDSAVDVAKENSDIILLHKSLTVLSEGVESGRKTFGNTVKYILNTTSGNLGNAFTLAISSLYFKFIPLLPSQLLLTNFVTDIPLTAISTDNVDESYTKRPNKWNIKFISRFMVFFGLLNSIFDIITMALIWFVLSPGDPKMFRTVLFVESGLAELLITFSIRTKKPIWKSRPGKLLALLSLIGVLLIIFAVYFPPLANIFQFEPMTLIIFVALALILISYLLIVEFAKKKFYAKERD